MPMTKKVWVCLFSCLVVRPVHLEVVEDMSADQFPLGLRRFVARHGASHQIIDNGKQFKLTRNVLNRAYQNMMLNDQIQDYVTSIGIQWNLIMELVPWIGDFTNIWWETPKGTL